MRKGIVFIISVFVIAIITACGSSANDLQQKDTAAEQSETTRLPVETETTSQESKESEKKDEETDSIKTAVIYFSATGNTKKIADMIADETSADLYEIIPVEPYTDDDLNYNDSNCRANKEQNDDTARPGISKDLSITTEYDVIYLGYPIWWGTVPRIIQTYLETFDLNHATIYTFCTSGSSDINRSISDLKDWYPSLNIVDGKRLNDATREDIEKYCNR